MSRKKLSDLTRNSLHLAGRVEVKKALASPYVRFRPFSSGLAHAIEREGQDAHPNAKGLNNLTTLE